MRLFGRDAAMWLAIIYAFITGLSQFVPALGGGLAWLVQALFTAILTAFLAWHVRPVSPAVFSGIIIAAADLGGRFGWHLASTQVAALTSFVAVAVTFLMRGQVTPANDPAPGFLATHR